MRRECRRFGEVIINLGSTLNGKSSTIDWWVPAPQLPDPVAMLEEYFFTCPYCWQQISMLLDLSVPQQTYVEDCEVCCRPIEVQYVAHKEELVWFEARSIEQ